MNKKFLLLGLLCCGLLINSPVLHAQIVFDSGDINAILEDNALREAITRYTSVLVFFQPEEATRLGFTSGNNTLNDRSQQTETEALNAFESVKKLLEGIDIKSISPSKQAEYNMLSATLQRHIWQLQQNRLASDPLYYAQALDAVYDLMLYPQGNDVRKQRLDLLDRVSALPKVAQQAKANLNAVSPKLAKLAMEKAYYAYILFPSVDERITSGGNLTNDFRDNNEVANNLVKAKNAIRDLFELFKQFSQQKETVWINDPAAYTKKLSTYYQIDAKPAQLEKRLNTVWDEAQHALFQALQPFELSADQEEVTLVEDLNDLPKEELPLPVAQNKDVKSAKGSKAKNTAPVYVPPTANQFEAVANQLESSFSADTLAVQFPQQASALETRLLQDRALPAALTLSIQPLTTYFSYQQAYATSPAYSTFWVRYPQGNELAQKEALNKYFNEPAAKLFISQEIVPGRYYQSQQMKNNFRRLFGSPLLENGWTLYALQLAKQNNLFITDEELLFVSWQHFTRAITALVDYRLHTGKYSYDQAITFLTQENGFSQEAAEALVDGVLRNPGEAVSYIIGAQLWTEAAAKYAKKMQASDITAMLLQAGNVTPQDLAAELKRIAKK